MSQPLHIGQTTLGVFYVWACSPVESFAHTRRLVPALVACSIYDPVDEDEGALRARFAHLLASVEGGGQ